MCLNAKTGERVWHFQAVKHDVWDRDFPTPPSLITVERDGKLIDAVSQATKSGFVFVFDRETGESLFPLEEVDAPWRRRTRREAREEASAAHRAAAVLAATGDRRAADRPHARSAQSSSRTLPQSAHRTAVHAAGAARHVRLPRL
ncbi:MAG: hypothetical protein R2724_22740 [Bryobacterales bacterium]